MAATGLWWRHIGRTCEESVRRVTDKILPLSADDPNIQYKSSCFLSRGDLHFEPRDTLGNRGIFLCEKVPRQILAARI
jgi:hypothetical protein